MREEKTLSERLDETNRLIKELVNSPNKATNEKKFRFKKVSKGQVKKGYVIVQLLKSNNNVVFKKLQVINNQIMLPDNKTWHLADTEYIGMVGKWPLVILPEWSNEPLTKEALTRKVEENKSTIKPQKQIIHLMEDARLAELIKPKRSAKGIVLIGIALLGLYLIGSQLGWFGG